MNPTITLIKQHKFNVEVILKQYTFGGRETVIYQQFLMSKTVYESSGKKSSKAIQIPQQKWFRVQQQNDSKIIQVQWEE